MDPKVLTVDESTKDVLTPQEVGTFEVVLQNGTTNGITAPTLVAVGGEDAVFCGPAGSDCSSPETVLRDEAPYYRNAALSTYVLHNSGHDINLHRPAHQWFDAAATWLTGVFGTQ